MNEQPVEEINSQQEVLDYGRLLQNDFKAKARQILQPIDESERLAHLRKQWAQEKEEMYNEQENIENGYENNFRDPRMTTDQLAHEELNDFLEMQESARMTDNLDIVTAYKELKRFMNKGEGTKGKPFSDE